MRVVIQFDEAVRPALAAWRDGLAADPPDARRLAGVYLDELKQRLTKAGGLPLGTVEDERTTPPTFWCELTGRAWVGYTVADGGTYFRPTRVIRVLDLQPAPPPSATPSSRRS